jgi:hypothetical protein
LGGVVTDAQQRYEQARELEVELAEAWRAAGSPWTLVNDRGIEQLHPLLKALQQAARDADRFAKSADGPGKVGRRVGTNVAPDRVLRPDGDPRPGVLRHPDHPAADGS